MPTQRQKRAVDKLVENHGNVSLAMREAGYEFKTAKNPKNLTESKGFKELLETYGLTEGFITKALVSDIKAKPRKRFLELSLGADILGMKKREIDPDKTINNFTQIIINPPNGQGNKPV